MSLLRNAHRCFANQQAHKLLNAFVTTPHDGAWLQRHTRALQEADARRDGGSPRSPVEGHVVAVKDNICTFEEPTTCASAILRGFRSPYPATVVQELQDAGALMAGKTNLDEFGMGTYSTNSTSGSVKNLCTRDGEALSAGGSSGGSAVAVATGQCDAALGTDTGGSVRFPAACTGVVGFKPSYGLVSRWGVIAYANSMDTVGVLAKNSSMARKIFDVIKGIDAQDPTSIPTRTRLKIARQVRERNVTRGWIDHLSLRIGVPEEYNTKEMQPIVREAWLATLQKLRDLGHSIHKISLPATKMALSAYYVLAPAEASSNLAKYDGVRYGNKAGSRNGTDNVLYAATRGEGLGEEVKRRIMLGSYSLSAAALDNYFIQAQKVRRLVQQDFNLTFSLQHPLLEPPTETVKQMGVDIILAPTAQSLPPKLSELDKLAPTDAYAADVLTVPASLAGLPAINVPVPIEQCGDGDVDEPNSIGMQVLAQYGDDDLVFRVARVIESLSDETDDFDLLSRLNDNTIDTSIKLATEGGIARILD